MKKFFLIAPLTFLLLILSFQSIAQTESVLVTGQKGNREFVISVVNPDNVETYNRHSYSAHSYAVKLKIELDKWLTEGFEIVDSSTSFSQDESGMRHEVIYILVKESLLKIKASNDN
ncbi:hypothetical protein [Brumimicrobium mesophilum]|uniref:hypothetical protein n=1 Tax=Brumimicrobium mesophilum TaxID=392717 RepID=UPI000D13F6DA|nr:hypothetical protein [Brumimicrobium mesophilum]